MAKISVIVPIYGVEKYLDKAIKSIRNQTYKDLEIILVDDGSPDNCPKMCDDYAKADPRIKVIHKENGGVSDAREAGVRAATGEYIAWHDPDDFAKEDYIEYMYQNLVREDADISTCGTIYLIDGKEKIETEKVYGVFDTAKAIENSLYGPAGSLALWNKLFKRELFDNIHFVKGQLYEDAYVVPQLFLAAKKIFMSNEPKYYYVLKRPDSITTVIFNSNSYDMIEAFRFNRDLLKDKYPQLVPVFTYRMILSQFEVFKKLLRDKNHKQYPQYKELIKAIKGNYKDMMSSPYFTKKYKMYGVCFKFCTPLYIAIMKKHLENY